MRLTVQFQSVIDALSPHDTVFSFSNANELSEPAMGVHTMLAPSGAGSITSSTSSLRRRRLKDISEDAEEGTSAPIERVIEEPRTKERKPEPQPEAVPPEGKREDDLDDLPPSALRAKALLAMRNSPEIDITDHDDPTSRPRSPAPLKNSSMGTTSGVETITTVQYDSAPVLPPILISPGLDKDLPVPPKADEEIIVQSPAKSADAATKSGEPAADAAAAAQYKHSPHLSQAENTSISQWSSEVSAYAVKPKKKKLGPRPHVEPPGRPRTSNLSETSVRTRPVANLPTTVKISNDRARAPAPFRPNSQQSSKSVPGRFHNSQQVNTLPPLPSPTHIPNFYRPESRSVVHKTPSLSSETTTSATPEKLRLMKALQLRKRNMLASQRASLTTAGPDASHIHLFERNPMSNSTTPTTATNLSEDHLRGEESSFTSREEPVVSRASLSSDTSSSVTPKAIGVADPKTVVSGIRKKPVKLTIPIAPPVRQNIEATTAEEEEDSDHETAQAKAGSPVEAYKRLTGTIDSPPKLEDSTALVQSQDETKTARRPTTSRANTGTSLQPLQVPANADLSEQSDGESFMDELANATVQEAKPVMVARTPVTPVLSAPTLRDFKDPNRSGEPTIQPRSSSFGGIEKPKSSGGRSTSALPVWPPLPAEPMPQPLTKKSTLGSGISRRIKALEVLSTRESTSPPRQPVRDIPSKRSAFDTFMKRSSFMKQAPNASTDVSPPPKVAEMPSMPTPTKAARSSRPDENAAPGLFAPAPKGEAVSVTARIIRDHDPVPPSTAPGDLNLHRSPLIVEHEKLDGGRRSMSRERRPLEPPRSPQKGGRFSFSSYRSMTQPRLSTAESTSKLSLVSKPKIPRSISDNSSLSEDKGKGSSRAQRLMKRVSNLTGLRGTKNLSSSSMVDFHPQEQPDTIQEEGYGRNGSVSESLLHVVDIGDVNVQFPDALLWKRRFMRIDDQGYLIFSPPANEANLRNVSRKFHLADFRAPTLPDLEREQMAWSVLLDMKDGSCIQCACENRTAQQNVLRSEYPINPASALTNSLSAGRCT